MGLGAAPSGPIATLDPGAVMPSVALAVTWREAFVISSAVGVSGAVRSRLHLCNQIHVATFAILDLTNKTIHGRRS